MAEEGRQFEEYVHKRFPSLTYIGSGEGMPDFKTDTFYLEAKMGGRDLVRIPTPQLNRFSAFSPLIYIATFTDYRKKNPFESWYVINAEFFPILCKLHTKNKFALRPSVLQTAKSVDLGSVCLRESSADLPGLIVKLEDSDIIQFFSK